jgi:hypothetical protein
MQIFGINRRINFLSDPEICHGAFERSVFSFAEEEEELCLVRNPSHYISVIERNCVFSVIKAIMDLLYFFDDENMLKSQALMKTGPTLSQVS